MKQHFGPIQFTQEENLRSSLGESLTSEEWTKPKKEKGDGFGQESMKEGNSRKKREEDQEKSKINQGRRKFSKGFWERGRGWSTQQKKILGMNLETSQGPFSDNTKIEGASKGSGRHEEPWIHREKKKTGTKTSRGQNTHRETIPPPRPRPKGLKNQKKNATTTEITFLH